MSTEMDRYFWLVFLALLLKLLIANL